MSSPEQNEIQSLGKELMGSPLRVIKKGLGSAKEAVMILCGIPINLVFALMLLFGAGADSNSWLAYFGYLSGFAVLFPLIYLFLTYRYALSKGMFILYEETIRPVMQRLFAKLMDKTFKDDYLQEEALSKDKLEQQMKTDHDAFLKEMPGSTTKFIMSFFPLAMIVTLFTEAVRKQRKTGAPKEEAKASTMEELMPALDSYAEELFDPSLINFAIVAILNVIMAYFAF